jgi:hypothetical protein
MKEQLLTAFESRTLRRTIGFEIKDVKKHFHDFCSSFSVIWTVKSVRNNGAMRYTTLEI